MAMPSAGARKKEPQVKKIVFVPHDNRPISDKQTADVVKKLGYEVIVPPDEILGDQEDLGHPDELWEWLNEEVRAGKKKKNVEIQAVVVSSDAMLYGSLVGSRKHDYSKKDIFDRAAKFQRFRKENPKLPLYVFSSIMRTPRSGEASGHMEPEYYDSYGSDIFRYTALKDKEELKGLDSREKKELEFLQDLVPRDALQDWTGRREKNLEANKFLINLAKKKTFDYLLIGRDDNAPYSQTHMESRRISDYSKDLGQNRFQSMAGIDEAAMLLLSRAVNEKSKTKPCVFVRYNWGTGPDTVPLYSDERISHSIGDAIAVAGGTQVDSPEEADLVLAVNTNPNGETYEASARSNDGRPGEGTRYFVDIVEEHLGKGYPVVVADVAYANGSDNAVMDEMRKRDLLFRLQGYAGWNTATNSTGFVIAEGMLARKMKREAVDELLLTRYLDDWAYQGNVRNVIARQLTWLRGDGVYGSLDEKRETAADRAARMLSRFVENNLPPFDDLQQIEVDFPWNRMFEADIRHSVRDEGPLIKVNNS
ncbi:MAG: DUF4127 family protein [Selenomonadaceae bacterium]|nr:DUF4127 family protein [Selenomonadaceae bacterium]